jgi:hypothetical protein
MLRMHWRCTDDIICKMWNALEGDDADSNEILFWHKASHVRKMRVGPACWLPACTRYRFRTVRCSFCNSNREYVELAATAPYQKKEPINCSYHSLKTLTIQFLTTACHHNRKLIGSKYPWSLRLSPKIKLAQFCENYGMS